jgi:hypothetical protein
MKYLLQHRWTLTIVLLAVIAISGCSQKSDNSGNTPSGGETTSPTASPGGQASPGSEKTTTKTIPDAAQKLGVAPQGTACPKNAPVKGLVTAKRGNVYHGPKSPDYASKKPDICFKDQATAEKAGFKAPTAK